MEKQIEEIQRYFPHIPVVGATEGGSRFLRLPQFITDPENVHLKLDCLFGYDNHLGYPTRLWLPKVIKTTDQRNWNHVNTYILGQLWSAYSYTAKGETLLEKLLSHLAGTK